MSGKIPQERLKLKVEVSEEEIADAAIVRKKPLTPSRPTALFEGSRETLEKTESSVIGGMEKRSDPAGSLECTKLVFRFFCRIDCLSQLRVVRRWFEFV